MKLGVLWMNGLALNGLFIDLFHWKTRSMAHPDHKRTDFHGFFFILSACTLVLENNPTISVLRIHTKTHLYKAQATCRSCAVPTGPTENPRSRSGSLFYESAASGQGKKREFRDGFSRSLKDFISFLFHEEESWVNCVYQSQLRLDLQSVIPFRPLCVILLVS